MPYATATGSFPIGFRRGWSDWQKSLPNLLSFAKANDFACLDLGRDGDTATAAVVAAGLRVGSVDLLEWDGLASASAATRQAAADKNAAYIQAAAKAGARHFFVVVFPDATVKDRQEQFNHAVHGYGLLNEVLRDNGADIVVEGYPGNRALVIAPESYRRFIAACPAPIAVNYDPSHLIRMGIDPIRFLQEFAPHVGHVHGKDTELFPEAVYEYGSELPPIAGAGHGFGTHTWRYTLPGHGCMRWRDAFRLLAAAGYQGCVSIELEDEHYNGTEAGEQRGLRLSGQFLAGC